MLRGAPVAWLLSALLAGVLVAERRLARRPELAALAGALAPFSSVVFGAACAAEWFTTVLESPGAFDAQHGASAEELPEQAVPLTSKSIDDRR